MPCQKNYTAKEAFQILSMTDESSRELSLSDSDSEYEPVDSCSSISNSEEERVPTKKIRQRGTWLAAEQDGRLIPQIRSAVGHTATHST